MTGTYYPNKDAELVIWLDNFLKVAATNLVALGLVADDLKTAQSLQPTYIANLNTVEQKRTEFASAVETKDATKTKLTQSFKLIVNKIQANSAVTVALKAQLGISTRQGGQYPTIPNPPSDFTAKMQSDGMVKLIWKRNGNAPNVQFIIEVKTNTDTDWRMLDVVTSTSYVDKAHKPGVETKYRIKVRRVLEIGPPSVEVIVV